MKRPDPSEYPEYYKKYIDLVKGDNVIKVLSDQIMVLQSLLTDIPEDKEEYRYAEGKWTIKEVLGHLSDTERIFAYRALCFARGSKDAQPGYDDEAFVEKANFNSRTIYDLAHEFSKVRESNIILFKSFTSEVQDNKGIANNQEISARALMFACAGHTAHHFRIIQTRYLFD